MAVMRILLGKIAKPRRNNKGLNRTYRLVPLDVRSHVHDVTEAFLSFNVYYFEQA